MIGNTVLPSAQQADEAVVSAFRKSSTAIISDNLHRLPGAIGLRPFHKVNGAMAGTALTVRVAAGDNLLIHKALQLVRPGDVVVVDGDGEINRALVGEILTTLAEKRGAAGFVINGAVRDAGALAKSEFPCFACAAIHRGPYKNGPGDINVSVSIGGLVVGPGDIVVGDADGVVAFPQAIAADLLEAVHAQEKKEDDILRRIRDGSYTDAYGKPEASNELSRTLRVPV
ncbi:RraA family protein [Mesorhizobium sp. M2A.F.Ca.ET.067.02.1.1]|uniref:RraA family protein n=1 Tax=Mesorhizobium sp. M2A.F.Ca.ET.067.02.1.1 TaxID=2496749 RepID=UPI000FD27256|nr:RraA family protein [Mesorhizobium sp. M2A.F.Ca.ET.067.02.1.1]RUW79509.1 RraA family protein [Mesorhizobium sp. M2A.F.Ca.ET.067.02.1.1]TIU54971.1 MAG: RraA family protein [Mesorhizobium sp.]